MRTLQYLAVAFFFSVGVSACANRETLEKAIGPWGAMASSLGGWLVFALLLFLPGDTDKELPAEDREERRRTK